MTFWQWLASLWPRCRAWALDDSTGKLNPSRLTALVGLGVWVLWAVHLTLDVDVNQPGGTETIKFIGETAVLVLGVNLGQFVTKQVADYKAKALGLAPGKAPPAGEP